MSYEQLRMESPIGSLYLVGSDKGLRGIYRVAQPIPFVEKSSEILNQAAREIGEYLKGDRRNFEIPLDLVGTDFQKRVWEELRKIPYGETRSYREIAEKIQNRNAVRAVGTANGKNPVFMVVPCHRVIAADGTLGGFAGGLPLKIKLLEIEKKAVGGGARG